MRQIVLTPDLLTGMNDIDHQHRALIACGNTVFSLEDTPQDRELAKRSIGPSNGLCLHGGEYCRGGLVRQARGRGGADRKVKATA